MKKTETIPKRHNPTKKLTHFFYGVGLRSTLRPLTNPTPPPMSQPWWWCRIGVCTAAGTLMMAYDCGQVVGQSSFVKIFSTNLHFQTVREDSPPPTFHLTCVTYHVSHVMCHMSFVTCYVSHVMCHVPRIKCLTHPAVFSALQGVKISCHAIKISFFPPEFRIRLSNCLF